jgi:hypothetical protein
LNGSAKKLRKDGGTAFALPALSASLASFKCGFASICLRNLDLLLCRGRGLDAGAAWGRCWRDWKWAFGCRRAEGKKMSGEGAVIAYHVSTPECGK